MKQNDWRPSASLDSLRRCAQLRRDIRQFFEQRNVLEVDVPVLGASTVSDPHLDGLLIQPFLAGKRREYFLQTSPEYFMKRLLSAGIGDIYSLGKAFRNDECSRRHNPEFTMLEWYRIGWDEHRLMDEVCDLVCAIVPGITVTKKAYGDVFWEYLDCDVYAASADELAVIAKLKLDVDWPGTDKSTWLDLLFSHCIEPALGAGLTLVYDYPKEQSALARIEMNSRGFAVARRFEAFVNGVELANGYWELTNPDEQRQRFQADNAMRKQLGKSSVVADQKFLLALDFGLPNCAGVALGVDRLMMLAGGDASIDKVLPFSFIQL